MHTIRSISRSFFALLVISAAIPLRVRAQPAASSTGSGGTPGLTNPLGKIDSLPAFMNAILDAVVNLGTILLVLALVYVGFQFVVAQGNQEKLSSARSALMWTVIGGLVLLGAKSLGLVISGTVESLK